MKLFGKAQDIGKQILTAFERPETLPEKLAPMFIKRTQEIPCENWSWRNRFLTMLADTSDARGYKQWIKAGRNVKKGSKAFHILAPCVKHIADKVTGEKKSIVTGFRATSVFRAEDTEGEDLAYWTSTALQHLTNLPLKEVAEQWGLRVELAQSQHGEQGSFSAANQTIKVATLDANVFLHELLHAADKKLGSLVERGQHWKSETVAEFGSAILAQCIGLESKNLGGAYSYIESYAKAAEKTPQSACMECLDRICKAVDLIIQTAQEMETE
jgi:hypothetical protein